MYLYILKINNSFSFNVRFIFLSLFIHTRVYYSWNSDILFWKDKKTFVFAELFCSLKLCGGEGEMSWLPSIFRACCCNADHTAWSRRTPPPPHSMCDNLLCTESYCFTHQQISIEYLTSSPSNVQFTGHLFFQTKFQSIF